MNRVLQSASFRRMATALTFLLILAFHFVWTNLFPDNISTQSAWLRVPAVESTDWWHRYWAGGNIWIGYSYALSLSFAVFALLAYVSSRLVIAGRLVLGGVSLSGFLAVFGCFLLGCCGSPMLGVYLSLFGASFLPFAKPLVALVTTVLIAASWFWLHIKQQKEPCSEHC